ncbi:type II secretion system major pseudopilin GspG [Candidatus Nomurabacteria bacterium]|nr:type II secretion system major pseudopilin GspG [Candidatus Nomurabacteria bacterium]
MEWHRDGRKAVNRRIRQAAGFDVGPIERLKLCGGFSFIEVMIVVVILAILATLLIPRVMGRTEDAKRAAAKAQISNIESALQLYKLDNGNFPSTEQGLKALVEKPAAGPAAPNWKAGGYLPKVPVDPWGAPYKYTVPSSQGAEFEILSFGADGTPGGDGKNADIVSWDLDRN